MTSTAVRDSDHLVGTPFRAGGREPGLSGGMDCYGLVLAMAKLRRLPLDDEAGERFAWYENSSATATRAAPGWEAVPPSFRVDDILILPNDHGAATHMAWVDDQWFVIQASRCGVWRVPWESVHPVMIYRHASRRAAH